MILTLTPNPSLDRTVSLPGPLQRGAVQRLTDVVMEPGGKGVNVARVLSTSGRAATAVLPAAEHDPILTALGALELPGLWNGTMSDWNTVFVEVPIETFNPVKTVNDLLRPEHKA